MEDKEVLERLGFKYNKEKKYFHKAIIPSGDPRGKRYILYYRDEEFWTAPKMGKDHVEFLGEVMLYNAHKEGKIDISSVDLNNPIPITIDGSQYYAELSLTPKEAEKQLAKAPRKENREEKKEEKDIDHFNIIAKLTDYDIFEIFSDSGAGKSKIAWAIAYNSIQHGHSVFYYDTEGYYVNNSCYIIANADKFLSIFLNSKKFEFYKHLTFASYGNPKNKGRSQLDYNKMINVPIPIITQKQKTEFELLHDNITKQYQQFYKEKNTFIEILKSKLKIKKLNRKINLWYLLDWEDFNTELEKLKIKLSLKKTKEWNDFFNSELYNIRPIILEINKIEEKINQKINQLYK